MIDDKPAAATPATGVQTAAAPKNNLEKKIATLDSVTPINIPTVPDIHKRFVNIYEQIHGSNGSVFYEQEKFFFQRILNENPTLASCTKLSLYSAFLEAAVSGVSLDPKKKLCYLTYYSVKNGTDANGKDKWEKRASLDLSPYGELLKRQMDGQIKYADNPKVVYEGDLFEPYEDEKGTRVRYAPKVPRTSNNIVACFIKITRNDGTVDYKWLFPNDMERLAGYSQRKNSRGGKDGKANELYSSGPNNQPDTGFLIAKTIKHAFANYPKMKLGSQATRVQSQMDDAAIEAVVYGDPDPAAQQLPPAESKDDQNIPITPSEVVPPDTPATPDPLPAVKQQAAKAADDVTKKGQGFL